MIRKLTGLFLCLLLLTGCTPKAQEDLLHKTETVFSAPAPAAQQTQPVQSAQAAPPEETAHLALRSLPLPQPLRNLTALCTVEKTIYAAGRSETGAALARTTLSGQDGELALPAQIEFVYAMCPHADGFALLGGSLPAAYVDANGSVVMNDDPADELWLMSFDADGLQTGSAALSVRYDSNAKFRQMLPLGDGFALLSQDLLVRLSPDGEEQARVGSDEAAPDFSGGRSAFTGMALTEKGLYVLAQDPIGRADARLLLFDPASLELMYGMTLQWRITGFGRNTDQSLLVLSETAQGSELDLLLPDLCRLEWSPIWEEAGAAPGGQIHPYADGFVFFESYDTAIRLLQPAAGPEPEKTVLRLAALGSNTSFVAQCAREYNLMQPDVRIELTHYSDDPARNEPSPNVLRTAIIAADAPDLYCFSYYLSGDHGYLPDVAPEEVCIDLLPYLDMDDTYGRSAFIPTLFDAVCKDGTLCLLPLSVVVTTCIAPSDLVPEPGIRFSDLEQIRTAHPEILPFEIWQTPENILAFFLPFYAEKYAASEEGYRNFGSQEFVDLLTLCKTWAGDGSTPSASEPSILRFGEVVSTAIVATETGEARTLFGSGRTYAGFPVESGYGHLFRVNSAMGISSQSEHTDEAWSFLRFCLSRQADCTDQLPVLSAAIERQLDYYRSGTATDLFGQPLLASEQEISMLCRLLEETTLVVFGESAAMQIVREEASAYFADACTAEQAAAAIASRAALFEMESQ